MPDKREIFGGDPAETIALLDWARGRANLTASGLAKRLGFATTTVQEYREGRRPKPGWLFVIRWLHACGFRVWIERVESDAE